MYYEAKKISRRKNRLSFESWHGQMYMDAMMEKEEDIEVFLNDHKHMEFEKIKEILNFIYEKFNIKYYCVYDEEVLFYKI